jgi:serine/threonine protein kinase
MLAPGARVGPYEIVSAIGAGGMGEVYRARDGKLGRDVAIKVLPDIFVGDPDRVARFEREAQVVASLNHPNIAVIHGFQESDGVRALVLELVEGETLGEIIARGPVPLADALDIARQIADALEAAHDKGIVHRDLKPDNVKITPEGKIKVLDFGLAKMLESEPARHPSFAGTMSPTLSIHATYGGVILGTAAYMSPEQARGKPVDRRTDIWSFGCVLFEMLTGRQTFEAGETISDAVAHILTREPDWNTLPAETPPHVRTLLRRCLRKDPSKRLPHIGLVRLEIDDGPAASDELAPTAASSAPQPASKKRVGSALGVLFAAVAAGVVATWALMRTPPATPQQLRFSVIPSSTQPFSVNGFFRNVTIAPDGRHVVYVAPSGAGNSLLMVRALDQLEAVPLRGVTGATSPFMSPDSRSIGFFAQLAGGDLKKVSITGGPALTLCRYQGTPRGATWGTNESIVFATNDLSTGLLRVPAAGGEPKVLTKPDPANGEQDHLFPSMLPGSRAVLFTIAPADGITDNSQVAVLDLTTGQRKTLIRGGSHAQYVDPGYVVYAVSGSLRAVRFDPDRLAVSSDPVPVVDQVMTFGTGAGLFEVSRSGTLVYVPGGATSGTGTPRSLVWVDRHGQEEAIPAPTRTYVFPRLSPDGQRVAVDIRDQENDIWIFDLKRPTLTKLTFNPGPDSWPIWTPDGRRIVFGSTRGVGAQQNLFWQPADGTGTAERLTTSANIQQPHSFSPDGRSLVVYELVPSSFSDLTLLPIGSLSEKPPTGKLETQPLVYTAAAENAGEISPDGHFVAYHSNESGQPQVYVRPFPDVDKGRWQISTAGGTRPAWGPDRRELFYMNPDGAMMAVPVQTTPTFSAGNPTKLFEGQWFRGQSGRTYDVAKDGRFLMIKDAVTNDQGSAVTMTVVVNWVEELKQKLPK